MQFRVSSEQFEVRTTRGTEVWQRGRVLWEGIEGCNVLIENTLHAQRVSRLALTAFVKVVESCHHAPHICRGRPYLRPDRQQLTYITQPTMSTDDPSVDAMDTDAPALAQHTDSQATASQQTYRQIAASHIEALNRLNSNLPDILALIAAALSQLTNNPIQSEAREDSPRARDDDIRAFSSAIKSLMAGFREALVDQINDLERYKVIPATMPKYTAVANPPRINAQQGQELPPKKQDPDAGVKNGGYGNFDVGVLNAQATGLAGGEDALDRVRALLDELLERSGQKTGGNEIAVDG